MFDVAALKAFLGPLAWFLTLGKSDTEQMRAEIGDLLHDTGQSIRTLLELEEILSGVDKRRFSERTFSQVYFHCRYTYTGADAPERAWTHCGDILRDLRRISFKAAKLLRTEWGEWSQIDESFNVLADSDRRFLYDFGRALQKLGEELDTVLGLLKEGQKQLAWSRFTSLREELRRDVAGLQDVVTALRKADDHVRAVLT
jgi:hypothetical protein